jgi:hypothetical protein
MNPFTTEICSVESQWALKVKTPAGVALEYRYPSERQARFMAAVIALGPSKLPPAPKMLIVPRRKPRAPKRMHELDAITTDEIESAVDALG